MKIFIFIFSFLITYFLTFKLIPFFRINFGQIPNKRSSHNKLTPSAGGIIFILISTLFSFFNNFYIPFLYLPLALFGLFDDKYDLKPILRYLAQVFTVILIIYISLDRGILSLLGNNLSNYIDILLIIISTILGTAIINFINFMDGIDGLVSGSVIIFLIAAFLTTNNNLLPLIGSIIGFLILNWNPAKIFMGDVGSTFLGAVVFGEIFINNNPYESFALFLVISPILGDAFLCIIRRYFAKQNIFTPHKLHLYQRLVINGWSHSKVSSIYILSSILIYLAYIIMDLEIAIFTSIFIFIIGFILDRKYAFPFEKAIS